LLQQFKCIVSAVADTGSGVTVTDAEDDRRMITIAGEPKSSKNPMSNKDWGRIEKKPGEILQGAVEH